MPGASIISDDRHDVDAASITGSVHHDSAPANSPRLTVCQVLHTLEVGGAEVLAGRIARAMTPRLRFVFACLDGLGTLGAQLQSEGFAVEVLDRRPGVDVTSMRRLAGLWRREQVDVVHAHQYTPFFYCLSAGMMRRRPPVLFTEHGRWFPDYPRRKRILFNRMFLRRCDRVVAVGESVRRALVDNEGIARRRIELVYNGIDLRRYSHPRDRDGMRAALGLADGDFAMVQVARLDALKDHLTAVRTIAEVRKELPAVRLLVVGQGPEEAAIRAEIAARGLEAHVRLLGLRQDVPDILAAADLFLLTSVSEGIPLTLIEAMAARLAIVSTNVGGVPEVVLDGTTGLLAPARDERALAAAVLRLAGDANERRRMGAEGAERAWAQFDERQMNAAYERLYREMAHSMRR